MINEILKKFINKQKANLEMISYNKQKMNGIYLTNTIEVLEKTLDVIPINNDIYNKKILEPACGEGIFILILILKVYELNSDLVKTTSFVENSLFFNDLDPNMVELTKKNINELFIELFNSEFSGNFNSFCLDFTYKFENDMFNNDEIKNHYNTFDYVVGNPPYVTLYGRRDKKKNEEQRVYYLNNYRQFPDKLKNGKINYVMLFIEHSLDFLKSGGVLTMIIDMAFFETAYNHCRKLILNETSILKIEHSIQGFENVASGQIILSLVNKVIENNNVKIINFDTKKKSFIQQDNWYNSADEYKFRFIHSELSTTILNKINNEDKTLKELYPKKSLRTCVMLLNMENRFVSSSKNESKRIKSYPYLQGSKGIKYKYSSLKYDLFFHYDKQLQDNVNEELKIELTKKGIKNKKRIGFGEKEIYDNPKVFIRQSAKEIIATYTELESSANNSIYVFSLRNNTVESRMFLKFLCGLLNSKIMTFYCQKNEIIRFRKGKQPQIKVSDLYKIKIPNNNLLRKKISHNVEQIYKDVAHIDKYKSNIDQLLYDYYKLDEKDISHINDEIISFL